MRTDPMDSAGASKSVEAIRAELVRLATEFRQNHTDEECRELWQLIRARRHPIVLSETEEDA